MRRSLAIILTAFFSCDIAAAQSESDTSSSSKIEYVKPILVPEPPRRIEYETMTRPGPTRWEIMCGVIAADLGESISECDIRHRSQTIKEHEFVGRYQWDIKTKRQGRPLTETPIRRVLDFTPDGVLNLDPCHDERNKYFFTDKSIRLNRDWDFQGEQCLSFLTAPTTEDANRITLINDFISDTCGLGCDIGWKEDLFYLYNRSNQNTLFLTKIDD